MKVIKSIQEMNLVAKSFRRDDKKISLVPTMGFLHEGHLSLIRKAKKNSDVVIVSIYVNPKQFAPNEDFDKYPRDFERDENLCRQEKVDFIFYPSDNEMYLNEHKTFITSEGLSHKLCGVSRPLHFKGVTTVVAKLFNIIHPHIAVFGQKDAQQALIIKRMVSDLNFDVEIIIEPTVRENDGLAVSSRNKYLSPQQRENATVLFHSLQIAEQMFTDGEKNAEKIKYKMHAYINRHSEAKIDYIEIVDTNSLNSLQVIKKNALVALAVYFGSTRLIDNILLENKTA